MNEQKTSIAIVILKISAALIVGFATFIVGTFVGYFDIDLHEAPLERALYVWIIFLLGGTYVGLILPRVWYLSILIAFTPLYMIGAVFLHAGRSRELFDYNLWFFINLNLVSLGIVLLASYLGSRLHRYALPDKFPYAKYIHYLKVILLGLPPVIIVFIFFNSFFKIETYTTFEECQGTWSEIKECGKENLRGLKFK